MTMTCACECRIWMAAIALLLFQDPSPVPSVHAWRQGLSPPRIRWQRQVRMTHHQHPQWNLRQELDKLGRFMGHDSWDRYTPNWMRQHARRNVIRLPPKERVESVRLVGDDQLAIITQSRQWRACLGTGTLTASSGPLPRRRRHVPSTDGSRLYSIYYDTSVDRHVVAVDGHPLASTCCVPRFVHETHDQATAIIGLCSEQMMVTSVATNVLYTVPLHDVPLASVPLREYVFSGLLGGNLHVYHLGTRDGRCFRLTAAAAGAGAPQPVPVRSIDANVLGSAFGVYLGCQDGTLKCCRFEPQADPAQQILELSSSRVHRHPVTTLVAHSHRIASCDEEGHVVVTDAHGLKPLYNLTERGAGVALDMNARFLVVAHVHTIEVWDHDVAALGIPLPRRAVGRGGRGQGGAGGGIKV